ncbi:hypothetical protein FA15DRAFT_219857 [Coprinopsis marcescibilis]|uniref:Uncharacterized protein n=1 Tax=Coprinopsis marcescibilis TaxID=230819 RepID=A0A5C3L566_COPMA|nr:hypothetical protein FA15DRAFT_219857 [Coprinopsis marcescibilis]
MEMTLSVENPIIRSDATKQIRHIILNRSIVTSPGPFDVEGHILARLFKCPALSGARTISTSYYVRDNAISALSLVSNSQLIPDLLCLAILRTIFGAPCDEDSCLRPLWCLYGDFLQQCRRRLAHRDEDLIL